MSLSIGIDLGTTYSVVAIYENDTSTIITNSIGNRTTPSWLSFVGDDIIIGEDAKQMYVQNTENTICNIKRLVGKKYDDIDVSNFTYNITNNQNNICININNKKYTPEMINAYILNYLKSLAETYTNNKITNCVITVPAYFNDSQRQSTIDSANIAGLNVLRLINEPTAAAIAYGLDKCEHKIILVYDLGGGTLDASILEISDGIYEVLATSGDTNLGGEDVDNILMNYCLHYIDTDITNKMKSKLKKECEIAKKTLSTSLTANICIEELYDNKDLNITITRAKFDNLCADFYVRCLEPLNTVINDSKINKQDIDEIILIGGSTRIPRIRDLIEQYFGKKPRTDVDPDETVAKGASIQAYMLNNTNTNKELILLDVIPMTLGIETNGGIMTKIINKNTTKPCVKEEIFSTNTHNQRYVNIKVYEGERIYTKDNHLLGTFRLNLKPMKKGMPRIKITYEVDINGILSVTGTDVNDGQSEKLIITCNKSRLTNDEINDTKKEINDYNIHLKKKELETLICGITDYNTNVRDALNYLNAGVYTIYDLDEHIKKCT